MALKLNTLRVVLNGKFKLFRGLVEMKVIVFEGVYSAVLKVS